MNNFSLYPCFKHWQNSNSIWLFSDPHFADPDVKYFRKNSPTNEEIIKNINNKVGKKDILICLGDVSDVSFVKYLRGYKVLIKGNHDSGSANYIRKVETLKFPFKFTDEERAKYDAIKQRWLDMPMDGLGDQYACSAEQNDFTKKCAIKRVKEQYNSQDYNFEALHYDENDDMWYIYVTYDNHLFDEVYEGPVMLNEKLILSHEPILNISWAFNIHGHCHSNDAPNDDYHMNICMEHVDYKPVCLKHIVESGVLKNIDSIHRITIDKATERSTRKKNK